MKRMIGTVILLCLVALFCFSCDKESSLDIPTSAGESTVDLRVC